MGFNFNKQSQATVSRRPIMLSSSNSDDFRRGTPITYPSYSLYNDMYLRLTGATYSGAADNTGTISADDSVWIDMIMLRAEDDGYASSVVINNNTTIDLPGRQPQVNQIYQYLDVATYGLTATFYFSATGWTYATAVPRTIVDSNRKVVYPPGLAGYPIRRDI